MKLVGLTSIGTADDPETSWTVPSAKSADQIKEALDLIKKFEFAPPTYDNDKGALDQIRRVSAGMNRKRATFDDESDDGIDDDEEELLFEPGGPTAMKKSDALKALKKSRRRRRKEGSEEPESRGLTDEQIEARAAARRARELEKNRKIKSELYVHDSDEDDEENDRIFFEAEERLRQKNKINIMKELLGVGQQRENGKKRMAGALDGEEDDDSDEDVVMTGSKKRGSSAISLDSDEEDGVAGAIDAESEEEEAEKTDTPISSPHRSAQPKRRRVLSDDDDDEPLITKAAMEIDDEDEENVVPVAKMRRPRFRAGFIMDSSDDE